MNNKIIVWDLFGGGQNSVYQAIGDNPLFEIYTFDLYPEKYHNKQYVKHNNHLTKSIKLTTLCIKYAYEHKNKNNKLKGLLEEYKAINYNNNSTEESKTKKQLAFEKAI
ncbi:hypothetical protein RRG39_01910 [Mycoplasmopsis cynos]|uniref:hypothetical protein n=1 Tax=Mycoplasmopsis cynos TaxID=171284 RepID=UPI002AFFB7CF|nr:hypothetical protein [Mycoplasmopsis cynos]WQQ17279.1 hypothetical protein RRG39_01910 [Mycoplasmopsis cynos]